MTKAPENTVAKRNGGRKSLLDPANKAKLAETLNMVVAGNARDISYPTRRKLLEAGYLVETPVKSNSVRGTLMLEYSLTESAETVLTDLNEKITAETITKARKAVEAAELHVATLREQLEQAERNAVLLKSIYESLLNPTADSGENQTDVQAESEEFAAA